MAGNQIPAERKKRLDYLFEALTLVAEGAHVFLCDMAYDYSRWSKTLVDEFHMPATYMYGAGDIWVAHVHPEDREGYARDIDNIFNGASQGHDMQYRAKNRKGEYAVCTCRGVVIRDENGAPEYFGGTIRNHSRKILIDDLTGLKNQYAFFEDIKNHIECKNPVRISVVGLRRLSEINEMHGYHVGNEALQAVGRYLLDHVGKRANTYHLDGSRFAVIMEPRSFETAQQIYQDIRTHFREGMRLDGRFVSFELSAGTFVLTDFQTDYQTIYSCLDFVYQESKCRKNGDLVEFQEQVNGDPQQRSHILHAIRNSIVRSFDGFYLLYQPVVDAGTEKVVGAEALLRWRSPEYGIVPPNLFIQVLEIDPLFPLLGEWILRQALTDAKAMQAVYPDFVINVILAYAQLEQPDFADTVWEIITETGFPPDKLCLEVTERCRLLDMELLEQFITTLQARGVRVALDDFGTGFSSVSLVQDLPFDTIKIDRSFVQKIEQDDRARKLIGNFTDIAGLFGAKVCVEGIETAGMRDILRKYGVHSFQGYFYARPLDIKALRTWTEERLAGGEQER